MDIKEVKPYNKEEDKTQQLNLMFNTISRQYDKFNDIMSMGLARRWRKKALEILKNYPHEEILDIAAGTADISIKAFEYLTPSRVTGIDISEKMLEIGRLKIEEAGLSENITLQLEDVSKMSFVSNQFDAAITSFGIRNFDKLEQSIREINRILNPNGKFVILEMSEPQMPIVKQGYLLYTKTLIPFAVRTFANDPKAYSYLTDSMKAFPQGQELIGILKRNGFKLLKYQTFFMGVCSLYVGEKV
ncbi:MAG: bifunctional demethylmenaquinone methyltransferase/2-methoxy-6-polyprenyl-1,4-benzoquinol methylase UbiE [Paludibacteraceae bacterium]